MLRDFFNLHLRKGQNGNRRPVLGYIFLPAQLPEKPVHDPIRCVAVQIIMETVNPEARACDQFSFLLIHRVLLQLSPMMLVAVKYSFMCDNQVRSKRYSLLDDILRSGEGSYDSSHLCLRVPRLQLVHGLFRPGGSSRQVSDELSEREHDNILLVCTV
ncbi:hypothetical protein D3C73_780840 [compost metagenome]